MNDIYRTALEATLSPGDMARVVAILADSPADATFGVWIPARSLVVVGAKLGGVLVGWLVVPAADEFEARALGESLAEGLAACYGPMREAREAAVDAIRRAAH